MHDSAGFDMDVAQDCYHGLTNFAADRDISADGDGGVPHFAADDRVATDDHDRIRRFARFQLGVVSNDDECVFLPAVPA